MSNLNLRIFTSLVFGPIVLYVIWQGGVVYNIFMIILGSFFLGEWLTLSKQYYSKFLIFLISFFYILFSISLIFYPNYSIFFSFVSFIFFLVISREKATRLWSSLGFLYSTLPIISLFFLRGDENFGKLWIFFLLTVVWGTDIGAYFIGKTLKGPKLASKYSPNKTISGAIGGIFSAVLLSYLFIKFWPGSYSYHFLLIVIVIILSILSQFGDIVESAIKRYFKVKDSSNLLPGHGGFMDRFDGLIFAAIAFYVIIRITENLNINLFL